GSALHAAAVRRRGADHRHGRRSPPRVCAVGARHRVARRGDQRRRAGGRDERRRERRGCKSDTAAARILHCGSPRPAVRGAPRVDLPPPPPRRPHRHPPHRRLRGGAAGPGVRSSNRRLRVPGRRRDPGVRSANRPFPVPRRGFGVAGRRSPRQTLPTWHRLAPVCRPDPPLARFCRPDPRGGANGRFADLTPAPARVLRLDGVMDRLRELSRSAQTWIRRRPRLIGGAIVLMALILFATTGAAAWFAYDLTAALPDREAVRGLGEMAQATTIYDATDNPVFTIFKEQRLEVPLGRISPNLIKAVISVEDQRFYDHSGVDLIRIGAAVVRNLREGRRAEGGSTITQQLARQTFLSRDKTFRRKIKEVIVAAHIEREFTKQEILEMYLNKVYFGDGLYGVEAASLG